jgi:hypothetical protein
MVFVTFDSADGVDFVPTLHTAVRPRSLSHYGAQPSYHAPAMP